MAIWVSCEVCQRTFAVKDHYAGQTGMCPHCGTMISVPEATSQNVLDEEPGFGSRPSNIQSTATRPSEPSTQVSLAMAMEIPKKPCPKCQKPNLVQVKNCFFCGAPFVDQFDPYHKWLGIPAKDQPPNHYRLLGLSIYETDVDVIAEASDQRMAHVRTHQTGPNATLSQKLLNEISAARLTLLNPTKKQAYDAALQTKLNSRNGQAQAKASPSASGVGKAIPKAVAIGSQPPVARPIAPSPPRAAPAPSVPAAPTVPTAPPSMSQMLPPTVWNAPPSLPQPPMGYNPAGPTYAPPYVAPSRPAPAVHTGEPSHYRRRRKNSSTPLVIGIFAGILFMAVVVWLLTAF